MHMDDLRVGSVIRRVRIKRGLRQQDLADAAGLSRGAISLIEAGHLDRLSLRSLRDVAAQIGVRIDVIPRWRGGDLDRLLNAAHSALHESVAAFFAGLCEWEARPEVSFAIYGERGVVDVLVFHAASGSLLVIELKTDIVDVQECLATHDRKRRLAKSIARENGWEARSVSMWLIVGDDRTNRRRAARHAALLRSAYPQGRKDVLAWLREPTDTVRALSFWSYANPGGANPRRLGRKRVRTPKAPPNVDGPPARVAFDNGGGPRPA